MESESPAPPPPPDPAEHAVRHAMGVLHHLRRQIIERMIEHINEHGDVIADLDPDERYNFWLQEIDERFLTKLNTVRRAMTEIQTHPGTATGGIQSRVKHCRIGADEPLGPAILHAVEELGAVNVVDIAIHSLHGDAEGTDIVIVYQTPARSRAARKPAR